MYPKILIIYFLALFSSMSAQVYTDQDVEICKSVFHFAADKDLAAEPIGEVITTVGKEFLGTDYLAYGIEKEGEEELVVNLRGLDCTTFLENVLTLSRVIKKGDTTFTGYMNELQHIRYRDGVINQYPSRLHYFSDWIYNNKQKGIIKDITKDAGGKKINFELSFMSSHPEYYLHLKNSPSFVQKISEQEKEISKREYYFIPKKEVKKAEDKIQQGDLIAFTSSIEGLDINHVGIAVKKNGRIHLLHAPEQNTDVQISQKPLPEYVNSIKKDTGIIILRPLEPKEP